ncbi:LAQU0S04e03862g1_1 [Lachancea quebecensis]|uniref:LAQU0S04e03862g1_1 n=1 Tax=Lachancea quebecensis TaxID=1654605 RepID=A0A0P1KSI4_9SACH|nr:LAQU0S04e03862g1_1 [Lachancea quebecensis]
MALQDIKEEPEQAIAERQSGQNLLGTDEGSLREQLEPKQVAEAQPEAILQPAVSGLGLSGEAVQAVFGMQHSVDSSSEALLPPLPDVHSVNASPTPPMSPGTPKSITDSPVVSVPRSGSDLNTYTQSSTSPGSQIRRARAASLLDTAETVASGSLGSTGTANSVLSRTADHESDVNTSFDLSKALEIPQDSAVPGAGSNSNSNPISPIISSPKISFKKKFSSTLLPAANSGIAGSHVNGDASANAAASKAAVASSEFSLHHLQRHGSVRSKGNTPELPRLSSSVEHHSGLGIEDGNLDNASKRMLRGYSVDSSNSSSQSFYDDDDLAFRPPHSLLEADGGSLASLHDLKSPRSSLNYSEAADNANAKKVPLLKRASSAILRKTSLSNKNSSSQSPSLGSASGMNHSNYHELRQTASFSTIPYDPTSSDINAVGFRNRKKLSLKTNASQNRCISNPEGLHNVASLPTPTAGNGFPTPVTNQSLGSKFRCGLTRIISGGATERSKPNSGFSSPSAIHRSISGVERTPTSMLAESPLEESFKTPLGEGPFKRLVHVGQGGLKKSASFSHRPHASPSSSTTVGNDLVAKKSQLSKKSTTHSAGSVTTVRNDSVFSGTSSDSSSNSSETDIITVDIDELTKALPVITVTEKFGARHVTPIQTQSNILLDRIYKDESAKALSKHATEKPNRITLREYINVLMKQQQIEDERFAVLEKNFSNNGWCSQEDLDNIQQKRFIINKKWAERISYYQGRLEA